MGHVSTVEPATRRLGAVPAILTAKIHLFAVPLSPVWALVSAALCAGACVRGNDGAAVAQQDAAPDHRGIAGASLDSLDGRRASRQSRQSRQGAALPSSIPAANRSLIVAG